MIGTAVRIKQDGAFHASKDPNLIALIFHPEEKIFVEKILQELDRVRESIRTKAKICTSLRQLKELKSEVIDYVGLEGVKDSREP